MHALHTAGAAIAGPQAGQRQGRRARAGFGLSQLRAAVEVAACDRRLALPSDGGHASALPHIRKVTIRSLCTCCQAASISPRF